MSIAYAPGYVLAHPPRSRPPRAVSDLVRLRVVAALLGVLVALGGGVYVLEARSGTRLDAEMTAAAQALLPGGSVSSVQVVDEVALIAEHRGRVERTLVVARAEDGKPVQLVIRDYDRVARVAASVSWRIEAPALLAGWQPVSTPGAGTYLSQVEREIDGHQVRLAATASRQGDHVLVAAGRLTIDGAAAGLGDAPPAVRAAVEPMLVPQRLAVPAPAVAASVRHAWLDGDGVGVELQATGVYAGAGGGR